jgi:hypothetical protein
MKKVRKKTEENGRKRNLGPKISMVVRYIHRSGILHGVGKNKLLGFEMVKIKPKNETKAPKNQK